MRAGWGGDGGWWWRGLGRGRVCGWTGVLSRFFNFLSCGSACRICLQDLFRGVETVFAEPSTSGVSDRQASGEFKWLVCVRRRGYPAAFLVLGTEDKRTRRGGGGWMLGIRVSGLGEVRWSFPTRQT